MDKIKKARVTIRSTRNLGSLHTELEKERPDIAELQVRLAFVKDKASQLEKVNQKIFEVMLNSDFEEVTLAQEIDAADEYRIKYQQAKITVSNILKSAQPAYSQDMGQVVQIFEIIHVQLAKNTV